MQVIAFPFHLDGSGQLAKVEQGSDEHDAQLIAHLLYTRKGERELVPDFGITDAAFSGADAAEVAAGVLMFGPEGVTVDVVDVLQTSASGATYTVTIERK